MTPAGPRRALVFGASGQIGDALLGRLAATGWQVDAVSRRPPATERAMLRWHAGGFPDFVAPDECFDAVFSCGPLDAFSEWYANASLQAPRVIAFGSTSLETKRSAGDPGERALAATLAASEARVFAMAHARGAAATLLRPTLVYGAARDASLSRIAALARRTGLFVLPRDARGLRQPVHVDDLAAAAIAALDSPSAAGQAYALPGGESLPYDAMVERVLAALPERPRLLRVPSPLFRLALAAAHAGGRLHGLPAGAVARMRDDLVFDASPAIRDLGYAPREFSPTREMLVAD
ncbi:NAD-dependent epimerase/dehydratase family protein [Luteimonas yindakuii]|uniref:NAD-dependent epimerase/dehydratase family protein n=1 Tax=Luteimonas yindakuii TaxID=2565782 RepID=A0A4Z1R011_9GAMM|nr:NAD-dependent epimerase/dehydratase family protein [Luteimonas yindakuii]TKS52842.1 NAD-dependent epimerase/dehydratase family protein [Luteimonas yindakuii]